MLVSVTGLDELRSHSYVHELHFPFSPGDAIPVTTDWRDAGAGYVIVCGRSARHTQRLVEQATAGLQVQIEGGGAGRCGQDGPG